MKARNVGTPELRPDRAPPLKALPHLGQAFLALPLVRQEPAAMDRSAHEKESEAMDGRVGQGRVLELLHRAALAATLVERRGEVWRIGQR